MMRVADYIARTLFEHGITHTFLVTGGGAMHLNDAFGRIKGMEFVACHHEQACAIAAESYFRVSNRLAAVNVTTGPGGTNAVTGVYGAWVDSIGMIVISGQSKWETLVRSTDLPLRQLGDQEVDIVRMVSGITKYAEVVHDPKTIRYHLEKALYLATNGRPGPVWLDIPINVQATPINPDELEGFSPSELPKIGKSRDDLRPLCKEIVAKIRAAERPVVLAGMGARLSGAYDQFLDVIAKLNVPVTCGWNAYDLIPNDHPLYAGRPGTIGDRAGNFVVQNSDLLLVLGSRLNIRQISYNYQSFAREAFKIMVDVDEAELKKPTLSIDMPVHADLKDFLAVMLETEVPAQSNEQQEWIGWAKERVVEYPVVLEEYWKLEDKVNPYCFMDRLFDKLPENQVVVCGDGTACVTSFQAAVLKKGQRLFHNSGSAPMGYDLPGAVGVCFARPGEEIVCLAGDGSIMMNLQELETIRMHKLPVKIFVLYNEGYHSIRQTQRNFFPDNIVGCGLESGLSFPSFERIAAAFEMPFQRISKQSELDDKIAKTLAATGPAFCEIVLDLEQQFSPKLSSRKLDDGRMVTSPLEDLAPFLPREELKRHLFIKPWQE